MEMVGGSRDVKKGKRGLWAGDLANHNLEGSSPGGITRCGLFCDCCNFYNYCIHNTNRNDKYYNDKLV